MDDKRIEWRDKRELRNSVDARASNSSGVFISNEHFALTDVSSYARSHELTQKYCKSRAYVRVARVRVCVCGHVSTEGRERE